MTQVSTPISAAFRHPLDGKPVLRSAPLRSGYRRSALPRFEDGTWDLSPAVFRENASSHKFTVHFDDIEDAAVEQTLREFLYARLNFDVPGFQMRLPPVSIRRTFNNARPFLEFVADITGSCKLAGVNQGLLDTYLAHLITQGRERRSSAPLLQVVYDLHHFREYMPSGGLKLLPWNGRSIYTLTGAKSIPGENKTPRLPEEIISPLLKWSLKYITIFSADILAARGELEALNERQKQLFSKDEGSSAAVRRQRWRKRLIAYIGHLRANGRSMPIWTTTPNGSIRTDPATKTTTPPVNYTLIYQHIGIDQNNLVDCAHFRQATKQQIIEAVAELGVEAGGMDTPISHDPDTGLSWRPRFDSTTVLAEEKMLQAACYIVCAYLSGMRDAEVQAMRSGCVRVQRSEDGIIERYQVKSKIYKRRDSRGQPETWTTIEPVAKAIHVLEQLTERVRERRGGNTLWRVLHERRGTKDHIGAEIVRRLNMFRDHLNAQLSTPSAPAIPPGRDGKPWHITTRQFRRTVAWHIANRPFGTVAGMIQYKHASIAAYEGYAGSSPSGFRDEVERERGLGQLDDVLSYFDRHRSGEVLMGPAAARISRELQHTADKLDPLPGHIADPTRVRSMLAHIAKTLFVGVMNDCFFDPATALCLNGKTEAATPSMAQCSPDRCPNSCITSRHRPLWAKAITDGEDLLKTKRLSPLQRDAIQRDLGRYRKVLTRKSD
ncbi:integrase [Hyphomicrobium sp. D-2]|uniref:integrase n=1 Tax=Hyphomicrobium sp. D-2 TaxID=3041621 RepID=UPI002454A6B1|nr:integrase [Hyphomicrobium sp. D-2]MDH4983830.1 integrase [Hyphomicrobium sp. D-2]